ncbi:MAG: hypothetical protein CL563_05970 [Alphaproteobacteria bacterium]|nr:hypothetical protein [Alphaproteobacteria bacterium]
MTVVDEQRSVDIWQISFDVTEKTWLTEFEQVLEDITICLTSFEIPGTLGWRLTAYTVGEPERADILARLNAIAIKFQREIPNFELEPVEQKDWVVEAERSLAPIHIGRFFISGSHVIDPAPDEAIVIRMDAGQAFGTGNHETTKGCLQAIDVICDRKLPFNSLDVGTGSGVLAIAIAKCGVPQVTASDNDPTAIEVAKENARKNGLGQDIEFHCADGLNHPKIRRSAQYDLIVANIVANPLIEMAKPISSAIKSEGHVVLSGVLFAQAGDVEAAYRAVSLVVQSRIVMGDWVTLILGQD